MGLQPTEAAAADPQTDRGTKAGGENRNRNMKVDEFGCGDEK